MRNDLWFISWKQSVDTNVGDHGNTQKEHEKTDCHGKFLSVWSKLVRPIIDDTGDERFHDTEFTVDPKYLSKYKWNMHPFIHMNYISSIISNSKPIIPVK